MYVTATVTAGVDQNAIAVPDASVLRDDENQPFVYVATGHKSVRPQSGGNRRKRKWTDANFERACVPAKRWWAMAAYFCNSRIRFNTRAADLE